MEYVILVDRQNQEVGIKEKLQAHRDGDLHRAFSVFLFNQKGLWLLQRRALSKYHSPGQWTNTCCSHPRPSETVDQAASRRLEEEMGIVCPLKEAFTFIYKADVGQGLIEHELDHVLIGFYDADPEPNPDEVGEYRFIDFETLKQEIKENPSLYTPWFLKIFENVWARLSFLRPS